MLLEDYDNNIITLPSQPTKVIIKLNDKIRCYDNFGIFPPPLVCPENVYNLWMPF